MTRADVLALQDPSQDADARRGIVAVRILMVTGAIPHRDAPTGASVVMAGQLTAMAARHQVTLVTFPPADSVQQAALTSWRAAGVAVHTAADQIPPSVVRVKRGIQRAVRQLRTA